MTSRISKLIVAAALAGTVPTLAAAHEDGRDCDRDRDERPVVVTAPVYAPPPPAWAPPRAEYPAPPAYRDGWGERWRDGGWRDGWRERALAGIRADLAALDARRAEFIEHAGWRPGVMRRFDRWYFFRRAELERRALELERVAWR